MIIGNCTQCGKPVHIMEGELPGPLHTACKPKRRVFDNFSTGIGHDDDFENWQWCGGLTESEFFGGDVGDKG